MCALCKIEMHYFGTAGPYGPLLKWMQKCLSRVETLSFKSYKPLSWFSVQVTPDEDFVLDCHPIHNNIVIGAGFSGVNHRYHVWITFHRSRTMTFRGQNLNLWSNTKHCTQRIEYMIQLWVYFDALAQWISINPKPPQGFLKAPLKTLVLLPPGGKRNKKACPTYVGIYIRG